MAATDVFAEHKKTEEVTAHILWMTTGLSCEGDSVAMTSATNPSLEDIITQAIPGMPKVVVHNQVVAYEVGQEYAQAWFDAEDGELQMAIRSDSEPLLAVPSPTAAPGGGPAAAECEPLALADQRDLLVRQNMGTEVRLERDPCRARHLRQRPLPRL